MYPNYPEQQNNQPVSVDYLNQISPVNTKKAGIFGLNNKIIGLIGGLVLIAIILLIASSIIASTPKNSEVLGARLTATQSVVAKWSAKLKDSKIRAVNSELDLFLTNTIRDITPLLANSGVDIEKISSKITSAESVDDLNSRLEDARLNSVLDRTYAREMAYKLETLMSLLKKTYASSSDSSLKDFLTTTYSNLQPIQKTFEDYNASNS